MDPDSASRESVSGTVLLASSEQTLCLLQRRVDVPKEALNCFCPSKQNRSYQRIALLAFLLTVFNVSAQDSYYALRYMPGQEGGYFSTLAAAENWIREEPVVPRGNQYLVQHSPVQLSLGRFSLRYEVKPEKHEFLLGSRYALSVVAGYGTHQYSCGDSYPLPPFPAGGCPDEETAAAGFLTRYPYDGGGWTGSYTGSYGPTPPAWWLGGQIVPETGRGYVYVRANQLPDEERRKWIAVYDGGPTERINAVARDDRYACPLLYSGVGSSDVREPVWPIVCYITSYASINRQSQQYDACNKDGNPCVAATGNKEYRETDFQWEGLSFSRAYNSIRDMTLLSGLSDSWAHTFSDRLLLASYASSDVYWIRSDGYFEALSLTDGTKYRSRSSVGVVLFDEVGTPEAAYGRWRIVDGTGITRWFNEQGRLARIESGSQTYTLTYCERQEYSAGLCTAYNALMKVNSAAGRQISFEYLEQEVTLPSEMDSAIPDQLVSRITSNEVELASYSYDALGRLAFSNAPGSGGRTYHYAETNGLCRTGAGDVIAECAPEDFPYHLTGVTDETEIRYASYTYDQYGRVTASEHAGGAGKVTLDYTSSGIAEASLPDGAKKRYQFDASVFRKPSQIEVLTTDGSVTDTTSYVYDDMRATERIDSNGSKTVYGYSDYHQTSRTEGLTDTGAVTPQTRIHQADWHPDFAVPTERRTYDADNVLIAKSNWTYNTRGQALTHTRTDPITGAMRTATTSYCEQTGIETNTCPLLGLVTQVDNSRTNVNDLTTYTYRMADEASCATAPATCPYRKGDLWKVTNALGHVTETLKYDGTGRVLSVKDPIGVVTDFEYHPRGWLTARKVRGTNDASETDDQITRIEYWPTGLVRQVTQPDGSFTSYAYDAAHRLTDIFDGDGNRIHYTLDNAGNREQEDTMDEQGVLLRTLSRVYNQLGQLQTQKDADQQPTDFTYDANGNTDTVTDALDRVTDHDYDPLNRLQRTLQDVDGIEAETTFEYDALDHLTKVTDPKGLDTDYTYNAFGDLLELSSPDTGTTTYTYDGAGNRKTQADARGITTTYGYDALNRLTSIAYSDASPGVTYTYDGSGACGVVGDLYVRGRLGRIADASGTTSYCYDRFGNLTSKKQVTNGRTLTLGYAYTLAGQLRSIAYPGGAVVDYVRNAQGQVTEVGAQPAGGTRQVLLRNATYYPFGPVAEWVYGNGRLMRRSLNQNYQPGFVEDPFPGGISIGYDFNEVGNLAKLRTADQTDPPQRLFDYDALNRLTEVKDSSTQALLQGYDYDATGNRTEASLGGAGTPYSYSTDSHRLSAVGGTGRSYDDAGNTTAIGGTAREFVYNAANRMRQVKQGGVATMNYVYNGKGEQVRKYLGTSSTYTLYDEAGRWLGDYDSSGAAKQQAIWLDDLPVGLLVGSGTNQKLHYVQPDALGTPRVVIDPVRDVAVWTWALTGEAFGNSAPNQDPDGDGTAFVLDMRFAGQRYDAASGLNQNGFREYESGAGRYSQSDPSGLSDGPATYGYVKQDPLSLIDPHGNSSRPGPGYNFRNHAEIARAEAIAKMQSCMPEECYEGAEDYIFNDQDKAEIIANLITAEIFLDSRSGYCGYVDSIMDPNAIAIGGAIFTGGCCSMAAVLAHEATHLRRDGRGGRGTEERARYIQQKCFGCSTAYH